jgi:hypothetical protein
MCKKDNTKEGLTGHSKGSGIVRQKIEGSREINVSISKGNNWNGNRKRRNSGFLLCIFLGDFLSLTIENIFSVRGPDLVICLVMCYSAGASGVTSYHVETSIS